MNNTMSENSIIIKQFNELNIEIQGTHEEPLFKAKDIGELLGIDKIRNTIKDFGKTEAYTMGMIDKMGREQDLYVRKKSI